MLTYDVYAASDVTDINTQQKLVDTDESKEMFRKMIQLWILLNSMKENLSHQDQLLM